MEVWKYLILRGKMRRIDLLFGDNRNCVERTSQEWDTFLYHLILSYDLLQSKDPIERVAAQPNWSGCSITSNELRLSQMSCCIHQLLPMQRSFTRLLSTSRPMLTKTLGHNDVHVALVPALSGLQGDHSILQGGHADVLVPSSHIV